MIDMEQIEALIWQTPGLMPVQRDFYEVMIRERKEQIIGCGMAQLMESREHQFDGPRFEMQPGSTQKPRRMVQHPGIRCAATLSGNSDFVVTSHA